MAEEEKLSRDELARSQLSRLRDMFAEILPGNRFYAEKFQDAGLNLKSLASLDELKRLPFTTKQELLEDQTAHPPYGRNITYPLAQYNRYHQTSGTTGQPLRWLDTPESWQWVLDCWKKIYAVAGVTSEDRLFFPFSFGPFLGFWSAFESATQLGCLCMPGGGMTSAGRLRFLLDNEATVILCTPTYALHLAETARQQEIDLTKSAVRAIIVAGEPGGSIPATRARIEQSWNARLFDHSGLTEIGPLSIECKPATGGLHIMEGDYWCEVIDPQTGQDVPVGQVGELIVTNLGRWASPLIRYRTGDLVQADPQPCPCGSNFLRLHGGILGRSDDLIHVKGNNVYPSALEAIIRAFPEVVEYRITVDQSDSLTSLKIEIEPQSAADGKSLAGKIDHAIRDQLLFRADVVDVEADSLPRFELKAKRVVSKK